MSTVLATYSGKDLNFAVAGGLAGNIQASGVQEKGIAQITIRMATTQSTMQVAMDGAVIPSVIPGDQGEVEIQVWQTSTLHQLFLAWHAALISARDAGDVSQWFAANMVIQCIVDGSVHTAKGVAPQKVPDKAYAEQAGRVTWIFMCADIVNE